MGIIQLVALALASALTALRPHGGWRPTSDLSVNARLLLAARNNDGPGLDRALKAGAAAEFAQPAGRDGAADRAQDATTSRWRGPCWTPAPT